VKGKGTVLPDLNEDHAMKTSFCLIKPHAMKTSWGVEV